MIPTPRPAELLEEEQGSLGLLAGDEEALLRAYRQLDFPTKAAVLLIARKLAGPEPDAAPPRQTGPRQAVEQSALQTTRCSQPARAPVARRIGPHFAVSARMKRAASAGLPLSGSTPASA